MNNGIIEQKKKIELSFKKLDWITTKDFKYNNEGKYILELDKNIPVNVRPVFFYIDYPVTQNYHDYLEISYLLHGKGELIIGNKEIPVKKGDLFLMNNVDLHRVISDPKEKVSIVTLYFLPEIIYKAGDDELNLNFLKIFYYRAENFNHIIPGSDVDIKVLKLIYDIYIELQNKKNYYELAVKTSLQELLLILLHYFDDRLVDTRVIYDQTHKNMERIREVFLLVTKSYDKNISLDEAARAVCMSPVYFCRFFKSVTGFTFKEYLLHFKIDKAKELLLKSSRSITDIAYEAGFDNLSYFYRVFKNYTKLNPKEFRMLMQK